MRTAIPALATLLVLAWAGCGDEPAPAAPPEPPPPKPETKPEPTPEPSPVEETDHADGEDDEHHTGHHAAPTDAGPAASPLPTGKPMLIDFTRDHCLPCQIMAPWVDELRKQHAALVAVVEINIDRPANKSIGRYFKARSIPTQVYVDTAGREVARHVGLATKPQMERTLKRHGFLNTP
jgi:thioredoxin 1